jgi:hypothetical protein
MELIYLPAPVCSITGGSTFNWTGSTQEVPCAGETGRGRDTLVEVTLLVAVVVGRASGATGYRGVGEAGRLVRGNNQLLIRLDHFFFAGFSSSWGVDMAMRVGGRPHDTAHDPAVRSLPRVCLKVVAIIKRQSFLSLNHNLLSAAV